MKIYLDGALVDPEAADISEGNIVESHLNDYAWAFRALSPHDVQQWPLGTKVRLTDDDNTVLFLGSIESAKREAAPGSESITYRAETWWWAASQHVLKHPTAPNIPRLVYNARPDDRQYDSDRKDMTVGEILADLAARATTDLAAFTLDKFGLAWPGITVAEALDFVPPKIVWEGVPFQRALVELLRWQPDVFLRVDRATGRFHFERRATTTTHTLRAYSETQQGRDGAAPAADEVDDLNEISLNPRLDLAIPRIKLVVPERTETWECYIDPAQITGTPDWLVGIPQTITKLGDLQFQLSDYPIAEVIEVIGGGQYSISMATGRISFREPPAAFYIRTLAETSKATIDTGFGGTAYDAWDKDYGILERYIEDLAKVTRKFYVQAVDGAWLFCPTFGEAFADATTWPDLIGKTVSIAGKGASTIAEVAFHSFTTQFPGGSIAAYSGLGIRLNAAIAGAALGDFAAVVTQDWTVSLAALADSLWMALRDVRWEGDLPAFSWLPELEIGHRVNLANTADARLAAMAEPIYELQLDPIGKTRVRLAMNRWYGLDDLLAALRQRIQPQTFQNSTGLGGASASAEMKVHKHDAADAKSGGSQLSPKRFYGAGVTAGVDNEILWGNGTHAIRLSSEGIRIGSATGNRVGIDSTGFDIVFGARRISIGVVGGNFSFKIDNIEYLFTHAGIRKLGAKVQ